MMALLAMTNRESKLKQPFPTTQRYSTVRIDRCNCEKRVFSGEKNYFQVTAKNSTCSRESFARGAHQKVVAFSYYEPAGPISKIDKQKEYYKGIKENLELIRELYPGWTMRLYYRITDDKSASMKMLCSIACDGAEIDLCDADRIPTLGNISSLFPPIWRFLPLLDAQVDVFVSRDLDSRVNSREVAAVQEFLRSNMSLHLMRDHPQHGAPILAGMWGAKVYHLRKTFKKVMGRLFADSKCHGWRKSDHDQVCLKRYVWPWAKSVTMSHDAFLCQNYPNTRPFPTKRIENEVGNFVGSVVSINGSIPIGKEWQCPIKCRPKNHTDWIYC